MRGKELDTLIEHELPLMLVEALPSPLFPLKLYIHALR